MEIKNPGPFQAPSSLKTVLYIFSAIGVAVFVAALMTDKTRAWSGFVHNHFYFLSLGLGGLFFAAIQWLTGAMWSAPVRRVSESFTAYIPVSLVTTVVLFFGVHELYHWSHDKYVQSDPILLGKSGYLNMTFFVIRNVAAVLLWYWFARMMIGNSIAQDANKDYQYTVKNKFLAPIFILIFAVTFTVTSFDQLMSLDAHWFSTIFGVYCFAGLFYSNLALTCLLTIYLKRKGLLAGIVNDNHIHDLGKFMFAFTVFWAYIGFSQFMLIWYANLPEETGYFIRRLDNGWIWVSIYLLVVKFFAVFFLLLPRGAKRNERRLVGVGILMLISQWIDVLWMVQPEFYSAGPRVGWVELGLLLGFTGVFGLVVVRFLGKNNVVAIGDPRLEESVFHHHQ